MAFNRTATEVREAGVVTPLAPAPGISHFARACGAHWAVCVKVGGEWAGYCRTWRASAKIRFNTLCHSLWGSAQVKRCPTITGHLARMDNTRGSEIRTGIQVLVRVENASNLVVDRGGGGGNPLRHRGMGVRPSAWD